MGMGHQTQSEPSAEPTYVSRVPPSSPLQTLRTAPWVRAALLIWISIQWSILQGMAIRAMWLAGHHVLAHIRHIGGWGMCQQEALEWDGTGLRVGVAGVCVCSASSPLSVLWRISTPTVGIKNY